MRKIESYDEINRLITSKMMRGVITNAFFSKEDYERAILRGELFATECDGGLFIFFERGCYYSVYYYVQPDCAFDVMFPATSVVETARRGENPSPAVQLFINAGYRQRHSRRRYTRDAGDAELSGDTHVDVTPALPCDAEDIADIFHYSFSPITGCIPTDDELRCLIDSGMLLTVKKHGKPVALLHCLHSRNKAEIRHLATLPEYRGRGYASALIGEFLKINSNVKCRVWCAAGNTTAERLYEKFGFAPDGYVSDVLVRQ